MSSPGRRKRNHDPGFDKAAEDVAQRHEDRREVIAENVEEQRQEDLDNVEDYRECREQDRVERAERLEQLTTHRLRFLALLTLAAAAIAVGVAVASLVNSSRISDNSQAIKDNARNLAAIKALQARIDHEGIERRNETCRSFEQGHKQEVTQLRRTYGYLLHLPAAERGSTLNKTIASQVRQMERDAMSDQDTDGVFVPKYCDEPGAAAEARGAPPVGLPEPDPQVPVRPKALRPPRVP
jgi:hypothetical protein